jgi:8-oxo-dGTP pyrophosphatase MutT (NUDIX family)
VSHDPTPAPTGRKLVRHASPGHAGLRPGDFEVHAAGGVAWRRTTDGSTQVLVVHRPRYDDWSFPKGKLDPGETFEQAAVRELDEETGFAVELGVELPTVTYVDHRGRSKLVRWWAVTVCDGVFSPNDEVDELAWMSPARAADILTYDADRGLLGALVEVVGRPRA